MASFLWSVQVLRRRRASFTSNTYQEKNIFSLFFEGYRFVASMLSLGHIETRAMTSLLLVILIYIYLFIYLLFEMFSTAATNDVVVEYETVFHQIRLRLARLRRSHRELHS